GVPDLLWGEIGVAVCVLRPNAPLNEHELLAWLAPKVARYSFPDACFFGTNSRGRVTARSPKR
ncbi:MAG TPA: hypothetical protein VNU00_05845, partial [Candidatus Binataceae bacterium]|nr:hypothetical protein [Candidatus Binataceae bacterium]